MTRYRKKPVEVEAWQVGSDKPMPEWAKNSPLVPAFLPAVGDYFVYDGSSVVAMSARTFEQTYEAVNDAED